MEEPQVRTYDVVDANPIAIVVRCVDRRFRKAHKEFIAGELGLQGEDFWPVKPPGGAGALARPSQMDAEFRSINADIEFFVQHSDIKYIILINHQDCRRYDKLVDRTACEHPERQDLIVAHKLLSRKYQKIEISAYFARFTDETCSRIFFEVIHASSLHKAAQKFQLA